MKCHPGNRMGTMENEVQKQNFESFEFCELKEKERCSGDSVAVRSGEAGDEKVNYIVGKTNTSSIFKILNKSFPLV